MKAAPHAAVVAAVMRLRAAGCVFAEEEAQLIAETAGSRGELALMVERRVTGLPLEHVLGWASFCGLRIVVTAGVFVPRRRTELLVHVAASLAPPAPVILDMGCGSGAVGAALAATVPGVELHAVDIDAVAVRCARRNVASVGGVVHEGDLYAPLPATLRGRVDLVVASAPYVPSDAVALLPPEARLYEPLVALDGGPDGLDVVRRVIAGVLPWLAPEGRLLLEISGDEVPQTVAAMTAGGLVPRVVRSEDLDATVVVGARGQASRPE